MSELSERWCRSIPSLRDVPLRVAFLRSELTAHELGAVADALDELCRRAEQADPLAREVLSSLMPSMAEEAVVPTIVALRAEAQARALLPLGRLLRHRAKPDPRLAAPEPGDRPVALRQADRVLTLGERKALARRPTRAMMDKLMRDPHPAVIRNLLGNPMVTEDDVLRLAARRPAFADVILEVARHPEWSQRARVRLALLLNPGSPAEVAVPLVRMLLRPELVEVASATTANPLVRAAAAELLERRPPVPEPRGTKTEPQ